MSGWALATRNPKTMLFPLAILPAVVDRPHLTGSGCLRMTGTNIGGAAVALRS